MTNVLKTEWETYQKNKFWLLKEHEGQYVLIKHETICGYFTSQTSALSRGYEQFGIGPFLVHQILEKEPEVNLPSVFGPVPVVTSDVGDSVQVHQHATFDLTFSMKDHPKFIEALADGRIFVRGEQVDDNKVIYQAIKTCFEHWQRESIDPWAYMRSERARIVHELRNRAKESEGAGTAEWVEALRIIANMIEKGQL
jgi:hypothetical protein